MQSFAGQADELDERPAVRKPSSRISRYMRLLIDGLRQNETLRKLLRLNPWVLWPMVFAALTVPVVGVVAIYYQRHVSERLKERWAQQDQALTAIDQIEKQAYRMTLEAYSLATLRLDSFLARPGTTPDPYAG